MIALLAATATALSSTSHRIYPGRLGTAFRIKGCVPREEALAIGKKALALPPSAWASDRHASYATLDCSAHDVEPEPGHVRSVKTNTPELQVEDDFGVTPPEPPEAPLKKPSPTPGASRLVIVCYHLPVRVVRDAENNWTASWGSSIIAKSPSESIADSRETWWAGTIHGTVPSVFSLH